MYQLLTSFLNKIFWRLTLAVLIVILGCVLPIRALDPHRAVTQYGHDVWEDELPQSTVHSITQSQDGYIWLGTYEGLVRFDGFQFTVFNSRNTEIQGNGIWAVFEDRDKNLWVGTLQGGLYKGRDGHFTQYTTKNGLSNDTIRVIGQDSKGAIWVGTERGLNRLDNGQITAYTTKNGLPDESIRAILVDKQGDLWIGTDNGLCQFKDEQFKVFNKSDGISDNSIRALIQDPDGSFWLGTNLGLDHWQAGKFTNYNTKDGLSNNNVRALFMDRDSNLWIGTENGGLTRLNQGHFSPYTINEGLSNNNIRSIYEDREGSLWVGTTRGLNRLRDGKFINYTKREGLLNDFTRTVFQDRQGRIWLGTDGGGVAMMVGDQLTNYTTKQGLNSDLIRSIYEDREGNIWIGTTEGLNCLNKEGKITSYGKEAGLANTSVYCIYQDRAGDLWVGTNGGGLAIFQAGQFTLYTNKKDGLANDSIRAIYEDREGVLWIGTNGGLNARKDGKFLSYGVEDGLAGASIFSIYQDATNDIWFSTDKGLTRLRKGKFTPYRGQNNIFYGTIFNILEDSKGDFWIPCSKGIYRIAKSEFDLVDQGSTKPINFTIYGKIDGMMTNQCNGGSQPSAWQTTDGRLWFATAKGVAVIDPNKISINKLPPPVVIEKITVDDKELNLSQEASLGPNAKRYEFYYAGLSYLTLEKVKFKCKLEGFDTDWVEVGTQRVAHYTNLSPGDYTFQVVACNNDGFWSPQAEVYKFRINPSLWKTWWAYLSYLLIISGLIYLGVMLRLQSLERRTMILEAKVVERTAEIASQSEQLRLSQAQALESERKALEASRAKSTFLANMSHELRTPLNAIIGFVQLMQRGSRTPDDKENLSIIMRSGEHLLGLINDVLSLSKIEAGQLTLNEITFDLPKLLQSLEEMFRARVQAKKLQILFDYPDNLPEYVRGDENKLRQILINLIGNAIKFTEVGGIAVRVNADGERAQFAVEDTGPGISAEELPKLFASFVQTTTGQKAKEGTGLGLVISRDMVRLMDGDIIVKSELGKGTTFSFDIRLPLSKAVELPAETGKVQALAPGQPHYRILVVDDKWENRTLLGRILAAVGFNVREVANGQEAVEAWLGWNPQLIWMDVRMPVMDGYTATKKIRQYQTGEVAEDDPYYKAVKALPKRETPTVIIALTASVFEQDRSAILAAGCEDFVLKPFREETIFEKISEYLGAIYIYDQVTPVVPVAEVTATAIKLSDRLAACSKAWRDQLLEAVLGGDREAAYPIIDQITNQDETLAQELRTMIKAYRFDELQEMLEN